MSGLKVIGNGVSEWGYVWLKEMEKKKRFHQLEQQWKKVPRIYLYRSIEKINY